MDGEMERGSAVHDEKYLRPYERDRLQIIRRLIPSTASGSALDLGCGSGWISRMLRAAGWSVTAVDLFPENVERARRFAEQALCADALSALRAMPAQSFQCCVVLELIEHLEAEADRTALLAELRRVAASGATLILSTPNRLSPEGLYGYYYAEKLRGVRWTAWDPTHHRIYTSFELLRILRRSGWHPDSVIGYYYGGRLSLPLTSSARFPLNRFGFNTIVRAAAR